MADKNLNVDVYNISEFVNDIKNQFVNLPEETMFMGIFGYTNEVYSNMLQNSLIIAAEYANEGIPVKAKFEKNIITHALSLGITGINAVPATMSVLLGFMEKDIVNLMKDDTFIFDKDSNIYIENFEFHTEYDIIITRNLLPNGEYTYTARYNIDRPNPLSTVSNPYLTPPARMMIEGEVFIYINCNIRQYEQVKIYRKILTDNTIENKTLSFDFESQLASFELEVTEGTNVTHLVPIYEGLFENSLQQYCYYSYIDSSNIRVKFDRDSYEPRINSDVVIDVKTTQGSAGNFTYTDELTFNLSSEKYSYSNLVAVIKPITDSQYGSDKKTIENLKRIIPKEALSRGSITSTADLNNFFNMIDTDTSKLYFYKKRHNQFENLYYSYILLKDDTRVIPTNTIDLRLNESDFASIENNKYVFNPGNVIYYNPPYGVIDNDGSISSRSTEEGFKYTTPFMCVINLDPLYVSYYMNIIDIRKFLGFDYINQLCKLQFISTYADWKREYLTDRNIYKLKLSTMQNVASDEGIIAKDDEGNITGVNMKVFAVLYNDKAPYRYIEADFVSADESSFIYNFEFKFETNDVLNEDNLIRIENLKDIGTDNTSYGYLAANTKTVIYILSKQDAEYGRDDADTFIPGLEGYTLSNKYSIDNDLDFFYNYSHIVSSTVTPVQNDDGSTAFIIKGVPVVKNTYMDDEEKTKNFIYQLEKRKEYINYSLATLQNPFGIDFKFFNTYGPAVRFYTSAGNPINRVNLSLKFRIKVVTNTDKYISEYIIRDIKKYIEDINNISDLHIPNLITEITNTYREQLVYFEFLDMNGYGPGVQHILQDDSEQIGVVPEFLNINTLDDGTPDINITLV